MTAEDFIEGTAVEPYQPAPPPPALFGTSDPVEVIQRAASVADALKDVIAQRKLYATISGKAHVKVEGWQLLGVMLGVTAVCVATEPVENGWKATVEARTADGRVIGRADALCTKDEGRWKGVDDYARLSMAQTRATSKALKGPLGFVISMAGYQTTPAEEMGQTDSPVSTSAVPPVARQRPEPIAATPPQGTERIATAKQRGLIFARAGNMPPSRLATIVLAAMGKDPRKFESEESARASLQRELDRLPASKVDQILASIEAQAA